MAYRVLDNNLKAVVDEAAKFRPTIEKFFDRARAMEREEIEIRTADDWIAVYKDGKRVWENHSCGIREGLKALGIPFYDHDMEADVDDNNPDASFPEELP